MARHETPKSLDRQLRNVALPPGLLPRLRDIAAMGDAELDFLIGAVPLPEGTLDRLREISSLSEADIDGELRDVELPRGMRQRVERAMRWQAQRAQIIGWAVAASLLAIISGAAYLAGVGQKPADQQLAHHAVTPPEVKSPSIPEHSGIIPPQVVIGTNHDSAENHGTIAIEPPTPADHGENPNAIAPTPEEIARNAASSAQPPDDETNPSAVGPQATQSDVFGGPPQVPPNLKLVQPPLSRGVSGPRVAGYDLISELRWGRHPFVVPAVNAALRESRVPIWTDTSSYELACRMVEAGYLPPPSQMHTEDFLAAMDYGFPLPSGAPLGIRAAAGPAPWGPPGMSLMQIGVQAAKLPRNAADASHLTLAIDASAAMRESGRWDLVRRALLQLTEQLGPRDRVSIVFFNGQAAAVKARQANQPEMRSLLSGWDNVRPDGFADVAVGLELAAGAARPAADANANKNLTNKLVLIADGLDPIDDRSLPHLRKLLHRSVDAGVKWEMIGLGQEVTLSPQWDELAEIGGHTIRHANTPDELYQRLDETLTGRSQIVAASVEMKITFNPDAVSRYRLIGHELNTGGGLSGASLQQDLRSGQAATALYEVELKPDGPTDVAFVEVSWRDPVSDASRHIRQPISRLQFLATWRECALPLQTAAVAAETAEVLRSSIMLPPSARVLDQVAELAADMNSALVNRPSVVRLKQLINQARNAKPFHATTIRIGS